MLFALLTAQAAPVSLTAEVEALEKVFRSVESSSCTAELNGLFDHLASLRPADVDRDDLEADVLVERVWQARLALQEQLVSLHAGGPVDEACVTGFRRADLASRYLVDHLLIDSATGEHWLTTDDFRGVQDLRSGDVLVTRGNALSSAGIAHIGRIDSQFSHNAMVHIDADGEAWVVEAYLERGGYVEPLHHFLEHGLGRVVVVRHPDAALAAEASRLAYERIAHGEPIDYDEAFETDDDGEQLFCSEIGPWAFRMAGGPTDLPLHPTVFPQEENAAMFAAMGITTDVLAAPVDLLFDPRFRIVGEWRDVPSLETMRRHDAVVESLFRWMEEEDYALDPTWKHRNTVRIGLAMRRTPGLGRLVRDMVHPRGERDFLVTGLALQDAGDRLWAALEEVEFTEPSPSREELLDTLEQIRVADLARWEEKPRKAGVHRVLNPGR